MFARSSRIRIEIVEEKYAVFISPIEEVLAPDSEGPILVAVAEGCVNDIVCVSLFLMRVFFKVYVASRDFDIRKEVIERVIVESDCIVILWRI